MSLLESLIRNVIRQITNNFESYEIPPSLIIAVLLVVTLLAIYEFVIYKLVLHRSLYNKAFNICIALIPYFISTIIVCLQSNLIITLGTIGALAIIRFRTAVKDPVDMIFIFWAIHIGIVCGCRLFGLAIGTSVMVSIVLIILNNITFGGKTHIVIVYTSDVGCEEELKEEIKKYSKRFNIKSKICSNDGANYVIEIVTKNDKDITEALSNKKYVNKFSIMEYDPDDII